MHEPEHSAIQTPGRPAASPADYVALARPDHWVKHVFILPGIVLAFLLQRQAATDLFLSVVLGFLSAAAVASANYVINEWLDAPDDAFHPLKSRRPAVSKRLSPMLVYAEYLGLAVAGLGLALTVCPLFAFTSLLFLFSGIAYNVPPLRTKERVYLDVLTESVNNPIRLTLGWSMVDPTSLPPGSLLLAFWMGGAFLMAIKRLAEYRTVAATHGVEMLALYRRSFRFYSEHRLLLSGFLYAQMASFFLAVFLIKYRIEYLLSLPVFALLFVSYFGIGLRHESRAQTPEKLFKEKTLMAVVGLLILTLALLTWIDLPFLERLTEPHYIRFPPGR